MLEQVINQARQLVRGRRDGLGGAELCFHPSKEGAKGTLRMVPTARREPQGHGAAMRPGAYAPRQHLAAGDFVLGTQSQPTAKMLDARPGVQLHSLELRDPPAYDYDSALAAAARAGAEALLVLQSPLFGRDRDRIIALAAQHRLPIISGVLTLPEAGALMAYGADTVEMYRRAATYVDKILKGT